MAECNIDQIVVAAAGFTGVNGTYTKINTDLNGFARYQKDGANEYFRIYELEGGHRWGIQAPPFPGATFQAGIYRSQDFGSNEALPDCPTDLSIVWEATNPANNPAPTVTAFGGGGSTEPTFGLPADVVALITSRFGTVANFLRLRNQGQV
jgi:hypothetical protein